MSLIEKYLTGQISEEELALLEKEVRHNPDFAEEVKLKTFLYAKQKSDLKRELLAAKKNTFKSERTGMRWINFRWLNRIAATLLIGVIIGATCFLGSVSSSPESTSILLEEKYPPPALVRNITEKASGNWESARIHYEKGNYTKVVLLIEELSSCSNTTNQEYSLYLGLSYLYQEQPNYEKAAKQLRKLLNPRGKFDDVAEWFLGLIYIKQEKHEHATKLLENIVKKQGWRHAEASSLLKTIR